MLCEKMGVRLHPHSSVLILVLMEYALREQLQRYTVSAESVLILVLMEYALRVEAMLQGIDLKQS